MGENGETSCDQVEQAPTLKIERGKEEEAYILFAGNNHEEKPTKTEVFGWYLYGMCSYFIHTVLIPIVFPLILSQTVSWPSEPQQSLVKNARGLECRQRELQLYEMLTNHKLKVSIVEFSALEWTSVSWLIGLILAAPVLGILSIHLDYGRNQRFIFAAVTAVGAVFCLPAGFFKTRWIFPPYIAAVVAANTIAGACHARHLGLMVRGLVGSPIRKSQFPDRRAVASWLSLHSTAAGCLGAAIISAFTYHMLGKSDDRFTSLWVVAIFSGLTWFIGILHIISTNRPGPNANLPPNSVPKTHVISIFKYPHATGSLAGVFLFVFHDNVHIHRRNFVIGDLCVTPVNILYNWLTYFIFPLISLPLAYPLQLIMKADAVKMQLLGFLLSAAVSGFGFYYHHKTWNKVHILIFAAVQSSATGLLHAFGRVLWLDCSPAGKEGAFSVWLSWMRALGTCAGFALASAFPGNISKSFGIAFCAAVLGKIVLIFGNISNFAGAKAAGHVREHSEKGSPVITLGSSVEGKVPLSTESQEQEEVRVQL